MKDSGKRQEFTTGSKRDTNEGKPRYDLLSNIALYKLAMWTGKGIEKYGERNWEKGQPLARFVESLERHLAKLKVGLVDEDHASAVMWNAMAFIHTKFLIDSKELPKELNNMPEYSEEVKKLLLGELENKDK